MTIEQRDFRIFFLIVSLIAIGFLSGCQSMGFWAGQRAYEKTHIEHQEKVHVPAYSWGFMKGWEARKLQHARDSKKEIKR